MDLPEAFLGFVAAQLYQESPYRALHRRGLPSERLLYCAGQNNQAVGGLIIAKGALIPTAIIVLHTVQ